VRTKVDEQDVAAFAPGQRAIVSGEDFGGKKLPATSSRSRRVAQKSDDPSNTSRQVLTTIALDQTLAVLRDGMTVDVDIVTHDEQHVLARSDRRRAQGRQGEELRFVVRTATRAGASQRQARRAERHRAIVTPACTTATRSSRTRAPIVPATRA
jgi:hypothetical protein